MDHLILKFNFFVVLVMILFASLLFSDAISFQNVSSQDMRERLIQEGKEYYRNGDYHDAIIKYLQAENLAQAKRDLIEIYLYLSLAYYAYGDNQNCRSTLASLFKMAPKMSIQQQNYPLGFLALFSQIQRKDKAVIFSGSDVKIGESVVIQLKTGSLLKGVILHVDEDKVTVASPSGELSVSRDLIASFKKTSEGSESSSTKETGAQTAIRSTVKEGDLVPLNSVDMVPILTKKVMPSLRMSETRMVSLVFKVNVLISEKGDVEKVEFVEGKNTYEYRPVREAVKKWKFKPAIKNGVRVKVWKQFDIRVNMR